MAYTETNFRTKKAVKEAVKAGEEVYVYQPGPFPLTTYGDNKCTIEGPHYPEAHKWYAEVKLDNNGRIITIK